MAKYVCPSSAFSTSTCGPSVFGRAMTRSSTGDPILLLGLGDVAVAPFLEGEIGQLALGHLRRRRRLDHLHAERELADLVLELQRQVVGRGLPAAESAP